MTRIPIARPTVGDEEVRSVERVLASGWLTQGPEVAAFEREFAAFVGSAHACAVSSCTVALHLALQVAGVSAGDEVITVSHSFIATANSIRYCGAVPLFVDIDPATFNIDPSLLEAAISRRTKAILCVHQMGMPCDLGAILRIGRAHGLVVVEDAACAAGSAIRAGQTWEPIGRPHGDVACFSFHPRKLLTTGDGGMLTTNRADWDARFRLLRQHGMSVSDTVRHGADRVIIETYPVLGYNYRLTDVQAAIGREQLKRLPSLVAERRRLAGGYNERLVSVPGVVTPAEPEWARTNYQSYCLRLGAGRDQGTVMQRMLDAGVSTRRGIMCAHREPPYRDGGAGRSLVQSERAQDECILLPLYGGMSAPEQDKVVEALVAACR